jgi:nicotinate phosphoribosyltransferase
MISGSPSILPSVTPMQPRDPGSSALLTDLYQLTMLQTYYEQGMTDTAVFELFFRRLPPKARNFFVAAGLEQVVQFLEDLEFLPEELDCGSKTFSRATIEQLSKLRFTGDIWAIPEGTVIFANEPIIRVVAPLPEAQLVETRIMNILHFQTMIASKAARAVLQAPGKLLVDFGLRRAHAAEAGLYAARATYLAGMSGSATCSPDALWGADLRHHGPLLHSGPRARGRRSSALLLPSPATTLLIDTYDTEGGA